MMSDVEFDRNQAAMAFAAMAHNLGWEMGFQWIVDDAGKDTGNVMLFVDTPWGVMRWELSPHEMLGSWKEYQGRIPDEYNPNLRRIRMSEMIKTLTAVKKESPAPVTPQTPEVPPDAPTVDESETVTFKNGDDTHTMSIAPNSNIQVPKEIRENARKALKKNAKKVKRKRAK